MDVCVELDEGGADVPLHVFRVRAASWSHGSRKLTRVPVLAIVAKGCGGAFFLAATGGSSGLCHGRQVGPVNLCRGLGGTWVWPVGSLRWFAVGVLGDMGGTGGSR